MAATKLNRVNAMIVLLLLVPFQSTAAPEDKGKLADAAEKEGDKAMNSLDYPKALEHYNRALDFRAQGRIQLKAAKAAFELYASERGLLEPAMSHFRAWGDLVTRGSFGADLSRLRTVLADLEGAASGIDRERQESTALKSTHE